MRQLLHLPLLLVSSPMAIHAGHIVTDTIQSRVLGAPFCQPRVEEIKRKMRNQY